MDDEKHSEEPEEPEEHEEPEEPEESEDFSSLEERLDKVLAGIDGMQRTLAALIAANGATNDGDGGDEVSIDDVTPGDDFDFKFD